MMVGIFNQPKGVYVCRNWKSMWYSTSIYLFGFVFKRRKKYMKALVYVQCMKR